MSGSELIKNEEIQNRIYTVRDVQVMLDKNLTIFYGVKTNQTKGTGEKKYQTFLLRFHV